MSIISREIFDNMGYKSKACGSCSFRFKDKGYIGRVKKIEFEEVIYGCRLGEVKDLTMFTQDLPKECPKLNMEYKKDESISKDKVGSDNCYICKAIHDGIKPCEVVGIEVCPCKTCKDFFILDGKCIYTHSCKKEIVYKQVKEGE